MSKFDDYLIYVQLYRVNNENGVRLLSATRPSAHIFLGVGIREANPCWCARINKHVMANPVGEDVTNVNIKDRRVRQLDVSLFDVVHKRLYMLNRRTRTLKNADALDDYHASIGMDDFRVVGNGNEPQYLFLHCDDAP